MRCSSHLPAMRNLRISASSWHPSSRKFPLRKTNHRLGNQEIAASWSFAEDAGVATKVCGFKYSLLSAKKICVLLHQPFKKDWGQPLLRRSPRRPSAFLLYFPARLLEIRWYILRSVLEFTFLDIWKLIFRPQALRVTFCIDFPLPCPFDWSTVLRVAAELIYPLGFSFSMSGLTYPAWNYYLIHF